MILLSILVSNIVSGWLQVTAVAQHNNNKVRTKLALVPGACDEL